MSRLAVLHSLKYRDFRWLVISSFASFMAMNMQMISRGWLVLRLANDSPFALSLVMMAFSLPITFLSLIGGALADRFSRKHIIVVCQIGNALLTFTLATLDQAGLIRFWHLLVVGLINGSLMAFNMPSRQSIISNIVPFDGLTNAIALSSSALNLTRIAGPGLAGLLIIYIDTSGVFYLNSGLYLFAALSIAMLRTGKEPASRSRKSMSGDIREGFSYAMKDPILLGLIIMLFLSTLFGFPYIPLLPAWAREVLGVRSDSLGLLMMMMGLGGFTGTMILASLQAYKKRGALLLMTCLLWGVAICIFSKSTTYTITLPLLFIVGLIGQFFMTLSMTLLQVYSSVEMRGRVMSISMLTFGLMPLSAVPFGAIAENIGTANSLFYSGAILIVLTIIFALWDRKLSEVA
ncbi:MAG: MFS transporter [Deltaproteobacteria bacterium]|nr:MFS transporter [Deltaproteobacteria bacterium]